jgi:hypothetical protein
MPVNGEIDRVVGHRKNPKGPGEQYRVLWVGQTEADATWEAASRIRTQIPLLVRAFEEMQQHQPSSQQHQQQHQDAMDTSDDRAASPSKPGTSSSHASDMARMRQQLEDQARLIQQMTAASSTSMGSRFAKAQPRAQELDEYHGTAGIKLDEWLEKLGRACALYSLNDQESLQFACSRLTSAALQWWNVLPPGDRAAIKDRAALASAMRRRFQPITTERMARDQLHSLRQTGDVNAYIAEHQRLSALIPKMDDATALHSFEHGLRADIAEKLRVQGVSTLNEAITMAARIGGLMTAAPRAAAGTYGQQSSRLHQMDAMDDADSATPPQTAMDARLHRLEQTMHQTLNQLQTFAAGNAGAGAKTQTKRGYQQAQGGGQRGSSTRSGRPFQPKMAPVIPGVSEDVVRSRWDNRQCLRCGQGDHRSVACPNPISSSN